MIKTAIGQDSHRFDFNNRAKKLLLAGIYFPNEPALLGNSDADVVLHAITNAISGITGVNILGKIADNLCKNHSVKDSKIYLKEALKYLTDFQINHLSISIECKRPKITPKIISMKKNIAQLLDISLQDIGITATSGEGLTEFGKGNGIQVFVIITVQKLLIRPISK
jgi:2-C-methyl-D-erythritol 2,4-cyclodiphosphate synthase